MYFFFRFDEASREPRCHDADRLRGHQYQPRSHQRGRDPRPPQRPDEVGGRIGHESSLQLDPGEERLEKAV